MIALTFILFVAVTGIILFFGYVHYVKPARMLDQLANTTSHTIPSRMPQKRQEQSFSFTDILALIGKLFPISPQAASVSRAELYQAGFRGNSAVTVFYGIRIVGAVVLLMCGLAFRAKIDNPLLRLILPMAAGGMGYILPSFALGRLVKRRHEQIRLSLPDVLDLMVICTEAGCGLDQAIVNVSQELKAVHPAAAEELGMLNMEMMAGKSRADSLRNLGKRCGEDEMKKLAAILIQTDKFGTSVGEALRTQSDFMRIRRRQEAEERAGKVGVKLVFPIFLFCMPALMVVTAGSGMLQLFHNLKDLTNMGH